MSNNETPVIRGQVLEAGLTALDSDNAYNRINVTVTERQLAEYPRNLFRLNVVIIAADDYDAMQKELKEHHDSTVALMKSLEEIRNKDEAPTKNICKHCGEPIRINGEGLWVHEDPDGDLSEPDYGWIACPSMGEEASLTAAEPISENVTMQILAAALKEQVGYNMTPEQYREHMKDAPCHYGLCSVDECSHCRRILRALTLLAVFEAQDGESADDGN